ncbi:hypothetical protein DPV79_09370 [Burkholderia reimsis]|uniref:Uncharacterized protein n=1 Tax=Burkholderia reimsis TaxID=2234132 RepID=A0A365QYU6_9BURK|nr:hypothetical protein DPV79_09370 [Burkholderia reimsis]
MAARWFFGSSVRLTALLPYCLTALPPYRLTALLPYCLTIRRSGGPACPRAAARDMRRHNSCVAHHARPPHTCACVLRNGMKPLPRQRSRPASDRSRS